MKGASATYIKDLILSPGTRLPVRELVRFFPEFGDSWLLTKAMSNFRPLRELDIYSVSRHTEDVKANSP